MLILKETSIPAADGGGEWRDIVGPLKLKVREDDVLAMVGGRRNGQTLANRMALEVAEEVGVLITRPSEAGRELGFVLGVARALVTDWEGVTADEPEPGPVAPDAPPPTPLPFTADRLEMLLRTNLDVYAAFDARVVIPLLIRSMEKNVYAPSPGTTSARAVKPTAGGAPSRSGARAATTPKTPRKRSKANGSGSR